MVDWAQLGSLTTQNYWGDKNKLETPKKNYVETIPGDNGYSGGISGAGGVGGSGYVSGAGFNPFTAAVLPGADTYAQYDRGLENGHNGSQYSLGGLSGAQLNVVA